MSILSADAADLNGCPKIYLDSWSFVAERGKGRTPLSEDTESRRAIEAFAGNWSNTEFVNFVNTLEGLVATLEIPQNSDLWMRCNAVWDRVVELEYAFWP